MPRAKISGRAIVPAQRTTNLPVLPDRVAIGGTEVRPLQLFTNPDRHPGGPGPWEHEPDKLAWIDAPTGKHCILLRQIAGEWAGFVGVDPDHPLWGFHFDAIPAACNLRVHGAIDYAQDCQNDERPEISVCHLPSEADRLRATRPSRRSSFCDEEHSDMWWLGFTANQPGDLLPNRVRMLEREEGGVYRDIDYMYGEVIRLAARLHALEASSMGAPCAGRIAAPSSTVAKKGEGDVQG